MRVIKFFINYDKEEKWLNEMAQKGYVLEKAIPPAYRFCRVNSPNNVIRVDYRTFKKKEDFLEYRTLFEDSGWIHIAGSKNSIAHYFLKHTENREEDIFSDSRSKAARNKQLFYFMLSIAVALMVIYVSGIILNTSSYITPLYDPKSLYLTPGLWEMTEGRFWRAFLFETPFAVMRGGPAFIFPIVLVIYTIALVQIRKLYNKEADKTE